jgi:omega-amidase
VAVAVGAGAAALAAAVATRGGRTRLPRLPLRTLCSANATKDVIDPPAPKKIKVALCQLAVSDDKQRNIATARSAIDEAAGAGADLVVLPEMWNCPYSNDSFPTYAEEVPTSSTSSSSSGSGSADGGGSPSTAMLSAAAAENRVVLVGGSIPERCDGRLYNTCFVYGRDGSLLGRHRKVHLFDIDIPGKITFKESLTLTPGEGLTVVDTEVGRLGIGICYDIRFPEMAQLYAARGVQLIVYPGAFNMTTGPAHWELLQKARAVDNQLFVATCSPARSEGPGYIAWGHSTAVGPFAEILGTTDEKPGIVYCEMDFGQLAERRANMPLRHQKRGDLYALMDLTR